MLYLLFMGMAYSIEIRERARALRLKGRSIKGIAKDLNLSVGTISLWMQSVQLPIKIKELIKRREGDGRVKGWEILRVMREQYRELDRKSSIKSLETIKITKDIWRLCAALVYWCEGSKRHLSSGVRFANSDPLLARFFVECIRNGFEINEDKLKARLHLHSYHNAKKQTKFWSSALNIPIRRFQSPYIKPNTQKRKREGYPGCVDISYGRAKIVRSIDMHYKELYKYFMRA